MVVRLSVTKTKQTPYLTTGFPETLGGGLLYGRAAPCPREHIKLQQ